MRCDNAYFGWWVRQARFKSSAFHAEVTGSNPVPTTIKKFYYSFEILTKTIVYNWFCYDVERYQNMVRFHKTK